MKVGSTYYVIKFLLLFLLLLLKQRNS